MRTLRRLDVPTAWDTSSITEDVVVELEDIIGDKGLYFNALESKLYIVGMNETYVSISEYNSTGVGVDLFWTNFKGQSEVLV